MTSNELIVLAGTAASIGFLHTLLGPDHYLPFIMLAKARHWNSYKTTIITLLCGIAHVLSSIVLGFIGIALGIAVFKLEKIESFRGELAAWFLLIFGFTYLVWGINKIFRNRPHEHSHIHENEQIHLHSHKHFGNHSHVHNIKSRSLTPWILFIIFVFGPCEPLIPLIMYPAAKGSIMNVIIVASIFGLTTAGTMLGVVLFSFHGLSKLPFQKIEKYSDALAGFIIFSSGAAIKFLRL